MIKWQFRTNFTQIARAINSVAALPLGPSRAIRSRSPFPSIDRKHLRAASGTRLLINVMAYVTGSPRIELVPLPARAQFLNVIESIFSGLARAIIHNSDYASKEEAKAAIDLYFDERNSLQALPRSLIEPVSASRLLKNGNFCGAGWRLSETSRPSCRFWGLWRPLPPAKIRANCRCFVQN